MRIPVCGNRRHYIIFFPSQDKHIHTTEAYSWTAGSGSTSNLWRKKIFFAGEKTRATSDEGEDYLKLWEEPEMPIKTDLPLGPLYVTDNPIPLRVRVLICASRMYLS